MCRYCYIHSIYTLKALDEFVISDEEVIENWKLPEKFKAMGNNLRLPVYTPLIPVRHFFC